MQLPLLLLAHIFLLSCGAIRTYGQIYEWEYIDPKDPAQGIRQSENLTPDGAWAWPSPRADLSYKNFTKAYLRGADLQFADLTYANLTNADLESANLRYTQLYGTNLTDANLTDAVVSGTIFAWTIGLTAEQFYTTANYRQRDLVGSQFELIDMTGWDFQGQNLSKSYIQFTTLDSANLKGANLSEAGFHGSSFRGADLSGADLTKAEFHLGNFLEGANLSGAKLLGTRGPFKTALHC